MEEGGGGGRNTLRILEQKHNSGDLGGLKSWREIIPHAGTHQKLHLGMLPV